MKKIICLLLACITLTIILASCGSAPAPVGEFVTSDVTNLARFQLIGAENLADISYNDVLERALYYVDRYTNIIYVYTIDFDANATRGMMTVLYNAEGEPMTLEEFERK